MFFNVVPHAEPNESGESPSSTPSSPPAPPPSFDGPLLLRQNAARGESSTSESPSSAGSSFGLPSPKGAPLAGQPQGPVQPAEQPPFNVPVPGPPLIANIPLRTPSEASTRAPSERSSTISRFSSARPSLPDSHDSSGGPGSGSPRGRGGNGPLSNPGASSSSQAPPPGQGNGADSAGGNQGQASGAPNEETVGNEASKGTGKFGKSTGSGKASSKEKGAGGDATMADKQVTKRPHIGNGSE